MWTGKTVSFNRGRGLRNAKDFYLFAREESPGHHCRPLDVFQVVPTRPFWASAIRASRSCMPARMPESIFRSFMKIAGRPRCVAPCTRPHSEFDSAGTREQVTFVGPASSRNRQEPVNSANAATCKSSGRMKSLRWSKDFTSSDAAGAPGNQHLREIPDFIFHWLRE